MRKLLSAPAVSAVLGGIVAAALVLVLGPDDSSPPKTVVQQAPIAAPAASESRGLTANAIYKRDAPGVVLVRAQIVRQAESPFDLSPQEQRGEATGSGFVIDKDGYILTNAHVVAGASNVSVTFEKGKVADAKVVGRDTSNDLALLKADPKGLGLKPLQLGDSDTAQVGDPVIAIGNPFGLDRTLTTGVVSALQRQISAPNGFTIDHVLQTDAAINPGNSGGPLLDAAGRVIGINSQIATGGGTSSGSVGIGFAVPVNTAKQAVPQLKETGRVQRAYLGVTMRTVDASLQSLNLKVDSGVLVQTVQKGGPADKAGIRGGDTQVSINGNDVLLGGDVIRAIGGKPVKTVDDVVGAVNAAKPGETLKLSILRSGKVKQVAVKLADRPSQAPSNE